MLKPKKPIKKANQTEGEYKASLRDYNIKLRNYELDNNPNQLENESDENYKQRKEYNDFRIKQKEDKNVVKKWYNEMDASQEADPSFIRQTIRKVLTSPIHIANYLDDQIDLNDVQKYKSTTKKAKETAKVIGNVVDATDLILMGGLDRGMKASPISQQVIEKGIKFLGGNKIQNTIEEGVDTSIDYISDFFKPDKKMKKNTINKKASEYAFGGSVHDPLNDYLMIQKQRASNMPNQIESPDTALVDNEIRLARAAQKAENNPWTQGLDLFGNLAMQVGSSMMSQGIAKGQGADGKGVAGFLNKNQGLFGTVLGGLGAFGNSQQSRAMGGIVGDTIDWDEIFKMYPGFFVGNSKNKLPKTDLQNLFPKGNTSMFATGGKVPINAEGEEIIETPQGQIAELKGPSHENGGIDLQVPEGTEIYSKRLKGPDGKSMADRKKARERHLAKLEKLAESNPTDKTIKKTLEKTKKDFQIQEQQDMQKMQMMHQMTQMQQAMEHFVTGGTAGKSKESEDTPTGHDIIPFFNYGDDYGDPDGNKHPYSADSTPEDGDTGNKFGFLNKIFGEGSGLAMGDMIGLGGQLYSTFAPMKNTQANRAGDTPNVNAFKEYGKDALHKMDQSKEYVKQIRDENLKDLELARTGQISRNRNSARGINTQRALDLTADANINDTKSKIFSQFAQAMQQIYGQEATLENDQDARVMQGEYARDLADRQDRDNYFSQMAQDIATKGTGLQHIGKNVNKVKERRLKKQELDKQLDFLKQNIDSKTLLENLFKMLYPNSNESKTVSKDKSKNKSEDKSED